MCNRTKLKILRVLHGVMRRALRVYPQDAAIFLTAFTGLRRDELVAL
jgi:hypothetical protein